jgi:hypothetical protein
MPGAFLRGRESDVFVESVDLWVTYKNMKFVGINVEKWLNNFVEKLLLSISFQWLIHLISIMQYELSINPCL